MKNEHLIEAALENTEVVVDQFISSDVVKEIPIFGTALKLCKAAGDIRDKIFAAKITRFLEELDSITDEAKEKMKAKVKKDPEESRKVGEIVLMVLDKIADLRKADLIAKGFLAYIYDYINNEELRRIIEAIDQAFIDDLNKLLALHNPPKKSREDFLNYLSRTGLAEIVSGKTNDEIGETYYEVSNLGNKLINAYRHVNKLEDNKSMH